MPANLSRTLAATRRLTTYLHRAAAGPAHPTAHAPFAVPRDGRVTGAIVPRIAWPRFLVWHSYLRSRRPTRASLLHAAHRLRGYYLQALARAAQARDLPLPVRNGAAVPHFALAKHVTRAAEDDPIDWWDMFGQDANLYPPDIITPEQLATMRATWQAEAAASVDFDLWLNGTALNDLQVLQILDGHWNGQAAMFADNEILDAAGIAGDFNLHDPAMLDWLRGNAGAAITNINETTRRQLADALWSGFSGEDGIGSMDVRTLGKYVQGVMNAWDTGLAGMSRARANLIAVTEVAKAETFGQMISFMQLGVKTKTWMTTVGACKICVGNQEQGSVPLMQPFPSGHLAPPGHPACRCALSSADGEGAFNPNDWTPYTTEQIQAFIASPQAQYWPAGTVPGIDLGAEFPPPTPAVTGALAHPDMGLLDFGDLPDTLQQVLSPAAVGTLRLDGMAARLAALIEQQAVAFAERVAAGQASDWTPPAATDEANNNATLDDYLHHVTDAQLVESDVDVQAAMSDLFSNIDDIMASLRGDLPADDGGDTGA